MEVAPIVFTQESWALTTKNRATIALCAPIVVAHALFAREMRTWSPLALMIR